MCIRSGGANGGRGATLSGRGFGTTFARNIFFCRSFLLLNKICSYYELPNLKTKFCFVHSFRTNFRKNGKSGKKSAKSTKINKQKTSQKIFFSRLRRSLSLSINFFQLSEKQYVSWWHKVAQSGT
jgi:hypothetical protein